MAKIPPKPKNDQNTFKTQKKKKAKIPPKTQKMTKIPPKPKNDQNTPET